MKSWSRMPETADVIRLNSFDGRVLVTGSRRFLFHPETRSFPPPSSEGLQQVGDLRRIVLQVRVEGRHQPAAGLLEAGGQGRGLAVVAAEADRPQPAVPCRQSPEDLEGAVGAAVVDEDHLEGEPQGGEGGLDLLAQRLEALLLVVHGNHHGQIDRFVRRHRHSSSPVESAAGGPAHSEDNHAPPYMEIAPGPGPPAGGRSPPRRAGGGTIICRQARPAEGAAPGARTRT